MPLVDLENLKLTFQQRRMIQLYGRVYLGMYRKEGWSGDLPFYAFRCKKHGIVIAYPEGWNETLVCPECRNESQ